MRFAGEEGFLPQRSPEFPACQSTVLDESPYSYVKQILETNNIYVLLAMFFWRALANTLII